jgi:hypothetical protein
MSAISNPLLGGIHAGFKGKNSLNLFAPTEFRGHGNVNCNVFAHDASVAGRRLS